MRHAHKPAAGACQAIESLSWAQQALSVLTALALVHTVLEAEPLHHGGQEPGLAGI
jgi:hypothetical protein